MSPWETETECQTFLDRVRHKFEKTAIFEVYEDDEGKWDLAMFDSRYSHWHTIWKYLQEHDALDRFSTWRDTWYPIWKHCSKRGMSG
jgi:hypothetical protein